MSVNAVLAALEANGETLALAESLTGGALADAFVRVPGASKVLRGSVVAYATDLKASLLGVDAALLERVGAVDGEVAAEMAQGARTRLGATYGLSATGVAGPDEQDGKAVGTVFIALASATDTTVSEFHFAGDRASIRAQSVQAAIELLSHR